MLQSIHLTINKMADTINNEPDRHPHFLEQTPSDLLDVIITFTYNSPSHSNNKYNLTTEMDQIVKDTTKILAAREADSNPMSMEIAWATTLSVLPSLNNHIHTFFTGTSVGEGTFGKVKLGKHELTGEKVITNNNLFLLHYV